MIICIPSNSSILLAVCKITHTVWASLHQLIIILFRFWLGSEAAPNLNQSLKESALKDSEYTIVWLNLCIYEVQSGI